MERKELIKGIPLFDGLNSQELEEIGDLFREVSRLRGETICREGEEGDSLYVLLSGELEVWSGLEEKKRIINRILPGDFFGEITLLTGEMRTATVTVARDARLLVVDRKTFESFFRKNAKMLEHLSKVMAQRMARASRGEITPRATTVISVVGPPGVKGKSLTASALAGLLEDFTGRRAIHVGFRLVPKGRRSAKGFPLLTSLAGKAEGAVKTHLREAHECPAFLEIGVNNGTAQNKIRASVGRLLEVLNNAFSYVVLDAGGEAKRLVSSIAASSDFVIRIEGQAPSRSKTRRTDPPVSSPSSTGSTKARKRYRSTIRSLLFSLWIRPLMVGTLLPSHTTYAVTRGHPLQDLFIVLQGRSWERPSDWHSGEAQPLASPTSGFSRPSRKTRCPSTWSPVPAWGPLSPLAMRQA